MASSYTSNYQLCQWEGTDKVLRTDFNGDNQKIDAALAGLADAVEEKTGLKTLIEQTKTDETQTVAFSLSGLDWTKWTTLHIHARGVVSGASTYQFCFQTSGGRTILQTLSSGEEVDMVLYVLHSGDTGVYGMLFHPGDCSLISHYNYLKYNTAFSFYAPDSGAVMSNCRLTVQGTP